MKNKLSLLVGLASLAAIVGVQAQTAVTDPVGYITVNVKAPGTLSFIAPTLVNKVEFAGAATASTATTITVASGSLTAGTFGMTTGTPAKSKYYVEITNGAGEGAWTNIVSNTADTITVADNMSSLITPNTTTIKIRAHNTIAGIFGATNSAGLVGSDQIGPADEIKILNSETKAITSVFYYNDGATQAWVDADFNEVQDLPIEPQQGLYIQKKSGAALSFVKTGYVKTGKTMLTADPGINVIAVPRAVGTNFLLDSSGLTNAGPQSGRVVSADQIGNADVLKIQQASGALKDVFHYDDGSAQSWVDADFAEIGATEQLKEGTSFVLIRKPGAGTFTWTVPAEIISTVVP